ncbi:Phosphoglycerate kinase [Candidatus Ornithobacterium hominis]|uniref:Phosphoglycerate kinase n=1 Tax=Candidatus Ornithobacterium hominis TaxID=2497989 RepID=A0A383TWG8_9FLAO|nr:phosphoglycerate kinase [Candidatus Ornithobacterium hominis]MCT7903909.1 phosphoglycerate kinase [Candidatus Ornithobacterium hominis]SZD71251.1 Phosphoglycerate kinase [Candidatus Ornithobacterium hominis]
MKTLNDFNFKDKKVLIRVDFNVPQDKDLKVTDTTRIESAKPTILKVLEDGGSVILMTHLGRPKGKKVGEMSLKHIADKVSDVIGVVVEVADDVVGEDAKEKAKNLKPGGVLMLENLRFREEEEQGEENFAKQLAELGDFYINDAFGTAHREHASTAVIAKYFKDKCFGYLMQKELEAIDKVLKNSDSPVTAILGGAKVSSKITVIDNILPAVDNLIIGGGMAYTFIKAQGGNIGNSIVEEDKTDLALKILKKAEEENVKVYLPIDIVVADDFNNGADSKVVKSNEIPDGWQGLDVGPETLEKLSKVIEESKTILWNGPVGVFEFENFAKGTKAIADAIENATKNGAFSLVGGGDSVAAVKQFNYEDKVSYVSTGGGAMLESLEGKKLPGVAAMEN